MTEYTVVTEYKDVLYRTGRYGTWSLSERLHGDSNATEFAIENLVEMGYEVKIEKVYA